MRTAPVPLHRRMAALGLPIRSGRSATTSSSTVRRRDCRTWRSRWCCRIALDSCGWARKTVCSAMTAAGLPHSARPTDCPRAASNRCTNPWTGRCGSGHASGWPGGKGSDSKRWRMGGKFGVNQGVAGREAIASDSSGHLYVATERGWRSGRNSRRDGDSTWRIRRRAHAGDPATAVYVDSTGTVWYGCGSGSVPLAGGQVRRSGAEGLPPERWEAILEDLEGNLWVRSERQLAVRSPATRRFQLRTESPQGELPPATNTFHAGAGSRRQAAGADQQGLARQTGTAGRLSARTGPDHQRYFRGAAGSRRIDLDRPAGLGPGALAGLQRMARLE